MREPIGCCTACDVYLHAPSALGRINAHGRMARPRVEALMRTTRVVRMQLLRERELIVLLL
eukprot:9259555-Pyramimonas_sp.AAC.2